MSCCLHRQLGWLALSPALHRTVCSAMLLGATNPASRCFIHHRLPVMAPLAPFSQAASLIPPKVPAVCCTRLPFLMGLLHLFCAHQLCRVHLRQEQLRIAPDPLNRRRGIQPQHDSRRKACGPPDSPTSSWGPVAKLPLM